MREIDDDAAVTVVGAGAIGSAVVRCLLAEGRRVTVWNRSAARTTSLVAAGAVTASSVPHALAASDLVLVALSDYAAIHDVLDGAGPHLAGRTVVALCTGNPDDARVLGRRVAAAGAAYLDAGIQATPATIGTPAALLVFGGSRVVFDRHRSTLEKLGTARLVGEEPHAAATWDLALFGAWYDAQLGLLRALATAREAGIDLAACAETAAAQIAHVVSAAEGTARELLQRDYPAGPATLAEHLPVVERLLRLRTGSALGDGGLGVVRERLASLVAEGRGEEGLTALAVAPQE